MKKRILSTLLAFSMVSALLPATALAAEVTYRLRPGYLSDVTFDTATGTILDTVTTSLVMTQAPIPDTIEGVPVTAIGASAFAICQKLTSITLPDTITKIDDGAFRKCELLPAITIPAGVTKIGANVFEGCESLTDIYVDDANPVYQDIDGVLYSKDGSMLLTYPVKHKNDYTIPTGVTKIADGAFARCKYLSTVVIPDGVTEIGTDAFYGCLTLYSITIPASVTEIGTYAFNSCTHLKEVNYSGTQEQWDAITIGKDNDGLAGLDINFIAETEPEPEPEPERKPIPPTGTAYARKQSITINKYILTLDTYALKDEDGNETNYVKVRDLAYYLRGSSAKFNVNWDGAVNLETNSVYTLNGSELQLPFSGDRAYSVATSDTNVDGEVADLGAIVLTDDDGGAYTYYQLRDLGKALGFTVDWTAEYGIVVKTN